MTPNVITTDHAGNMLLAGSYPCPTDLDPGAAVFNLSATTSSAFIQKLTPTGTFIWAKGIGKSGSGLVIKDITTDAADNIYVTGYFNGFPDFDPGPAAFTYYSVPEYRMFILKLNSAGVFQWVKIVGDASGFTGGYSVRVDAANNIYVGGTFSGDVDFNPDTAASAVNMLHAPDYNIFLLKLNSLGEYKWAYSIGGTGTEDAVKVEVDNMGGVYYSAYFSGVMTVDPVGASVVFTPTGSSETIISKFDTAGNFIWARQLRSATAPGYVRPKGMSIDNSGHIVVTGFFSGEIDFDPSAGSFPITSTTFAWSAYTIRLDANGNLSWAKSILASTGYGVDCDAAGNVYTVGTYSDNGIDVDPGPGVFPLHNDDPSTISYDCVFLQCLDSTGTFKWASGTYTTASVIPATMCVLGDGVVYHAGTFWGSGDFDPGPDSTILTNPDGSYIYAVKIAPPSGAVTASSVSGGDNPMINVYPNPTEKSLSVQSSTTILQVVATNVVGKEILNSKPNATSTSLELTQPGLYTLHITTREGTYTRKVVVTH